MKKVGIRQVAEQAGVSVATVSYVMNNSGRVAKKTREHVLAVAAELGFVRDDAAVRLRTGQSKLLGVILNKIENPFFAELVAGIELAAYRLGYLTLVSTAQNDRERQAKLLHSMVSQGVGALIISPVHETSAKDVSVAVDRGIPIVSAVRDIPNSNVSFVGVDEERSGYLAARALMDAGHREMVFIGGYDNTTTWNGRQRGILRALREEGAGAAELRCFPGPLDPEFSAGVIAKLLETQELGKALISFNDDMATGLYAALRNRSLRVGQDVSVVSFDNVPICGVLEPELSTVDICPRQIGETSAEIAIDLIRADQASRREHVFEPTFVSRQSLRR